MPATIAVELSVLGSFYRWAMARHAWPSNPVPLAARPKVHNVMPRPVDDDTWLEVWLSEELPDVARVALGLGYYCGLRRAEILALHGNQVWGQALVSFTRKGGGDDRFDYGDVLAHWDHHMPRLPAGLLEGPLRQLARTQARSPMPWSSVRPQARTSASAAGWRCGLSSVA